MLTRVMNICAKFYSNPFIKWRNIASRGTGVNGLRTEGRHEGQPENVMSSAYCCWRRY